MANVTTRQWGLSESATTELWGSPYLQQSGFGFGNGDKCGGEKIRFFMPIFNFWGKNGWNTEGLAQMSVDEYGQHCCKIMPAQTWTCQRMKGSSPTLPSCSSLNCLYFPECPSCKHVSKGVERGRAGNSHYKVTVLIDFCSIYSQWREIFQKVIQSFKQCLLFSSDTLYREWLRWWVLVRLCGFPTVTDATLVLQSCNLLKLRTVLWQGLLSEVLLEHSH